MAASAAGDIGKDLISEDAGRHVSRLDGDLGKRGCNDELD